MDEKISREPLISAAVFVTLLNLKRIKIDLAVTNFDDFTVGNFGAYFFRMGSAIQLKEHVFLINDFELHQSGSVVLVANFSGFKYRGGVRFAW
jgi:hypothetical protein